MKFIRYAFLALMFIALSSSSSMAQRGGGDDDGGKDRGGDVDTGRGDVDTGRGDVDTGRGGDHEDKGDRNGDRGGKHGRFDVPIFRFLHSDSCRLALGAMMADTDAAKLESLNTELTSYEAAARQLMEAGRTARAAHDTAAWRQIRVQMQLLRIQFGGARAQLSDLIHSYRDAAKRILMECGRPPHPQRGENEDGEVGDNDKIEHGGNDQGDHEDNDSGEIQILKVSPIHPNPYNSASASAVVPSFEYGLAAESAVRIDFSDAGGNLIATFVDGIQPAGTYSQQLPVANLQAGGYYVRIMAGEEVQTLKFSVLR